MFLLLLLQHLNLLEALEGESDFIFELNHLHTSEAAHAERPDALQLPQLDVTELALSRCRCLRGSRERLIHDFRVADHLQTAEVGIKGAATTQLGHLSVRATVLNQTLLSVQREAVGAGRVRQDARQSLVLMDERLLAEVRASLEHSNKSSALFVLLKHIDTATADDVELVAGIALTDDGRARWEVFALKQIGNLVEDD